MQTHSLKQIAQSAARIAVLSVIDVIRRAAPKQEQVVLHTDPDFSDHCTAIFRELRRAGYPGKIIWLLNETHSEERIRKLEVGGPNVEFHQKLSLAGTAAVCRSRTIYLTHGLFAGFRPPANQVVVNLWHAMPVKLVGCLLPDGMPCHASFTIATCPKYVDIMSQAMGTPVKQVLLVGNPRNDLLLCTDREEVLRRAGIDAGCYKKTVFYLPTFRKSVHGDVRIDGEEWGSILPSQTEREENDLRTFLEKQNILLICKPHPASVHHGGSHDSSEHVLCIDQNWLWDHRLTLYELLSATDALVTDLSSVFIDYLLLDRPMFFYFPDIASYRRSRGLVLEPYEQWVPGPLCETTQGLMQHLLSLAKEQDSSAALRREINQKLNTYQDGQATARLLAATLPWYAEHAGRAPKPPESVKREDLG